MNCTRCGANIFAYSGPRRAKVHYCERCRRVVERERARKYYLRDKLLRQKLPKIEKIQIKTVKPAKQYFKPMTDAEWWASDIYKRLCKLNPTLK
jgi:hypothetical protein